MGDTNMNVKAFWSRVRIRIKERSLTQKDAAIAIGIEYPKFRKWMSRNMIIPMNYGYRLSRYLGVSIEYLITGHGTDKVSRINEKVLLLLREAEKNLTQIRLNVEFEE